MDYYTNHKTTCSVWCEKWSQAFSLLRCNIYITTMQHKYHSVQENTPHFATFTIVQCTGGAQDMTFSFVITPSLPVPVPQLCVQKTMHLTTL